MIRALNDDLLGGDNFLNCMSMARGDLYIMCIDYEKNC
jgi:hypothetical protein